MGISVYVARWRSFGLKKGLGLHVLGLGWWCLGFDIFWVRTVAYVDGRRGTVVVKKIVKWVGHLMSKVRF